MIKKAVVSKTALFTFCFLGFGLICCSPGAEENGDNGDTDDLTIGSGGAVTAAGGESSGGQDNGESGGSGGMAVDQASGGAAPSLSGGAMNDEPSGGSGGRDSGSGGNEAAAGGSDSGEDCLFSGSVQYQLNNSDAWPAEVVGLIEDAMDEATYYYNCYANLSKFITVNYNPSVPTAEANVDGWLSFGADQGYMQVATAMHEVAHTLGVAYYPWTELMENGRWTGSHVEQLMSSIPAEERDPDQYSQRTYITGDSQHFWPYGLNQASEYQSEWSLINHVRIVAAMQLDKQAYLESRP